MKILFQVAAIMVLVIIISCNNSDDFCLSNQQSVQASFYSSITLNDSTVSGVTITAIGSVAEDDTIYNSEVVSESFLPLSMMNDTSRFLIQILNQRDTVSFVHSKELSFISEECGFIFKFELDTVLHSNISFIDSVSIEYPSIVYNESTENVKIYLY
ncbi:DUF6452 family protein [Plebeiibacterium sediminum]|uniref:DUF6452 family protein n=1 Tax=Plebeiibacterium sediminum TaxID=2992112 RepID=A0AAE3M1Q8_9BACT|nr:DUF6452 family protein [Plebeiobacterium sediminum]MCW3785534.1 DUF6452 family protein [Plebeiobacterium sediminum]